MSTTKNGPRRTSAINVCGWCAGAAMCSNGNANHRKCYSTAAVPCACAVHHHTIKPDTADVMARYCRITVDEVYRRHGQKRRVVSDERKEQLRAQLVKARAKKGGAA